MYVNVLSASLTNETANLWLNGFYYILFFYDLSVLFLSLLCKLLKGKYCIQTCAMYYQRKCVNGSFYCINFNYCYKKDHMIFLFYVDLFLSVSVPAYSANRLYAIFFILFLVIGMLFSYMTLVHFSCINNMIFLVK